MHKFSALAVVIIISFSQLALASRTYRASDIKNKKPKVSVRYVFGEKFRLYPELQYDCKGNPIGKNRDELGSKKFALNFLAKIKCDVEDALDIA